DYYCGAWDSSLSVYIF
nr:immunoglobulin light chain junction region [Macaca mulatta]MOV94209.1 immunoglobulin light chain junction region [Macaca mulatta]MOV95316.1 immunoglobulin light chain junction region [Macaca mulatta]MOV95732.1 immunoglobulin light chain junction region [Macaca mulatta]MOV96111.1 immunoglobulin light chain junction region [Macaca mulatta]